jgi:hypothetical protein
MLYLRNKVVGSAVNELLSDGRGTPPDEMTATSPLRLRIGRVSPGLIHRLTHLLRPRFSPISRSLDFTLSQRSSNVPYLILKRRP